MCTMHTLPTEKKRSMATGDEIDEHFPPPKTSPQICCFLHVEDYHRHRMKMGVAEGVAEVPVGACFPLEYNVDYMDGGKWLYSVQLRHGIRFQQRKAMNLIIET